DTTHNLVINAAATSVTAAPAAATFSAGDQTVPLSASVKSAAGTVDAGSVTFTILNGQTVVGKAVSSTVRSGNALATFTIPGGTPAGTYTIQAAYSGTSNFAISANSGASLAIAPAASATTTTVSAGSIPFRESAQSIGLGANVSSAGGTVGTGT